MRHNFYLQSVFLISLPSCMSLNKSSRLNIFKLKQKSAIYPKSPKLESNQRSFRETLRYYHGRFQLYSSFQWQRFFFILIFWDKLYVTHSNSNIRFYIFSAHLSYHSKCNTTDAILVSFYPCVHAITLTRKSTLDVYSQFSLPYRCKVSVPRFCCFSSSSNDFFSTTV